MFSAGITGKQQGESKADKIFKKRTELPIYTESPSPSIQNNDEGRNEFILQGVQMVRSEGCKLVRTAQSVSDRCFTFFRTGVVHASSNYTTAVDYLREERNILQRIGAIGGASLFGYTLGFRKGFFKRFLFTISGGVTAAAICYPSDAEDYLKQSSVLSKKYTIIGYHFLSGVSKDLTGYELPTFPLKASSQEPNESVKKD